MRAKMGVLLGLGAVVGGVALAAEASRPPVLVAGGTEVMIGSWNPGQGTIEPGGKIRGWQAEYQDTLAGPAGELASGVGPATMNCNLDQGLTGPCWGTFEFANDTGRWTGTWQGTFNFATGAGSYRAVGRGQDGLEGLVLQNDVVYPGYPAIGSGTGYVFSTVKGRRGD